MKNDCINYIYACPQCIKTREGNPIKSKPINLVVKVPKIRYVVDEWKLLKDLADISGFNG